MSMPSPTDDLLPGSAALQHEIEQVHLDVHELAEEVAGMKAGAGGTPRSDSLAVRVPPRV